MTLILCSLIDLFAAIFLAKLSARIEPSSASWVLGLYLFNPKIIFSAITGLETPLLMLTLACCFYFAMSVLENDRPRDWVWLGVFSGCAVLARTDTAIILVFLISGLILHYFRSFRPTPPDAARRLAHLTGSRTAVVMPWFGWNLVHFGTFMQSSAVALPEVIHEGILASLKAWKNIQIPMINLRNSIYNVSIPYLGADQDHLVKIDELGGENSWYGPVYILKVTP